MIKKTIVLSTLLSAGMFVKEVTNLFEAVKTPDDVAGSSYKKASTPPDTMKSIKRIPCSVMGKGAHIPSILVNGDDRHPETCSGLEGDTKHCILLSTAVTVVPATTAAVGSLITAVSCVLTPMRKREEVVIIAKTALE